MTRGFMRPAMWVLVNGQGLGTGSGPGGENWSGNVGSEMMKCLHAAKNIKMIF
jgi:hypothetical protein